MIMTHPGLPQAWQWLVLGFMAAAVLQVLVSKHRTSSSHRYIAVEKIPLLGQLAQLFSASPWPLILLKVISVALFLAVIAAGLFGTPVPERNLATTLTWTIWWSG